MTNNFAKVVVAAGGGADKAFDYAIGADLRGVVRLGHRVLVPFGKSRNVEGFVVDFCEQTNVEPSKIKQISEVLEDEPIFSKTMLDLARFLAEKYSTPLAACLRAIMPAGIGLKNDYIVEAAQNADFAGIKGKQKQIVDYIKIHGRVSQRELAENFGRNANAVINALASRGELIITHIYEAKDYILRIRMAEIADDAPNFEEEAAKVMEKGGPQARVLGLLLENRAMPTADIQHLLQVSPSPVKTLETKGLLRISQREIRRNVVEQIATSPELTLTNEQESALNTLKSALNERPSGRRPVLIHGITGSGKTEVYIRIIQEVLNRGKQAIVLVPEISLTPQTIAAFAARFGNQVTATHSRLSLGERYDQWKKARDGQISVMVGPRSAIFTPFDNLGIIIIDEEHETTYKSGSAPKYDTLAVAEQLARLTGAMLVLGSATPKLDTFHRAQRGDMELVTLRHRINKTLIQMEIADMRTELANGNKTIFSAQLYKALQETLDEGKQAILFINRRGHSTFVSCRSCGHVCACTNCSVNFTYHMYSGRLICHYCAATIKNPKNCPTCGSIYIKYFGIGTQKIEEHLAQEFPETKVLRMDLDTTGRKNSHHNIISDFSDKKAQILVGTQMIAKGLNFPEVALVGIVAADLALNTGDFRAAETTYQLITQVAGRAARGEQAGRVIIQTYNPEHYSIKYAVQDSFEDFYAHEIEIRRQMNYPPYTNIFQIVLMGEDERRIIKTLHVLAAIMKQANRKGLCEVLGPAPAMVVKIKQNFRWKLLVKCADEDILRQYVYYCLDKLEKIENLDGLKTNLTPNPAYIL
ncbi:MAG: primosomal protein N' [Clostridiales bacterium]|jgi:primosomal protein N' (replication factor Y)|nr:primosomal protein N' [Clostridiales bacterium]